MVLKGMEEYTALDHFPYALRASASEGSSLTRHYLHRDQQIKPEYMGFSRDTFLEITHRLELPLSYLHLRKYANGCGNFFKHTSYDEDDRIIRQLHMKVLSSVFRITFADLQSSSYMSHTLRPIEQNRYGQSHHHGVPTAAYRPHCLMACLTLIL